MKLRTCCWCTVVHLWSNACYITLLHLFQNEDEDMLLKHSGSSAVHHLLNCLVLTDSEWSWGHAVEAQWWVHHEADHQEAGPSEEAAPRQGFLLSMSVRREQSLQGHRMAQGQGHRKDCHKRIVFNGSIMNQVVQHFTEVLTVKC